MMDRKRAGRVQRAQNAQRRAEAADLPRLDRIAIAIDFAPPSVEAARWVADVLAPEADLILIHALGGIGAATARRPRPSPEAERWAYDAARAELQAIADSLGIHRAVRVEVRDDRPAPAVACLAGASGADLIVVGPHGGRESVPGIGSTAERLVRMSPVPVLLVRHARPRLQKAVVAVDRVDLTPEVMRWADLFCGEGVQLILTHVLDPRVLERAGWQQASVRPDIFDHDASPNLGDYIRNTESWLSSLTRDLEASQVAEFGVSVGVPGDEIMAIARHAEVDLIVLGRRGRGRRIPAVVGSTASTVLRNAPCPVLIVVDPPDARFDSWDTEG